MNAVEYLRTLQKDVNLKPAIESSWIHRRYQFSDNAYDEAIRLYRADTCEGIEKILRDTLIAPFLLTLPEDAERRLGDIYVGLLPTYEPNAWVIPIGGDNPLVILHFALMSAINCNNELFLLVEKLSHKDTESANDLYNKGQQILLDFFIPEKYGNHPRLPSLLSQEECIASLVMSMGQELFVIAHEFSHIYLGHLNRYENKYITFGNKRIRVRKFSTGQQEELDADVQAVKWLVNLQDQKVNSPLLQFVSLGLACCIDVLRLFHFVEVNLGIPSEASSHPSSFTRLRNISEKCRTLLSATERMLLNRALVTCSKTELFKIEH